jgi:hypothetical protein
MRDSFGSGDAMREEDQRSEGIFSYIRMEQRMRPTTAARDP